MGHGADLLLLQARGMHVDERRRRACRRAGCSHVACSSCMEHFASSQGNIKRDPTGYSDEFALQWRHYRAQLQLFLLKPAQESAEFGELVTFIAHVSACYPHETESFAGEVMELLGERRHLG